MSDIVIVALIGAWWTFSVLIYMYMANEREPAKTAIATAVFWPVFSPVVLLALLWRIPFRSTKQIRVDLRNRKLLREFEAWHKARGGGA